MPVPQHVLNWLYSVLTSEYHDVNRTYNDVANALLRYPSLSPRTDVHTFPNGTSALLLHLAGTLPVNFRGNVYRFPISIWVPHAYPKEPPIVYVTPTEKMMVRPGQHVDPQGQVYHPYLVRWAEFWDKSILHDFLAILSDIFAKEPPVVSRQQAPPPAAPSRETPIQSPPPVPPLPPEMATSPASTHQQQQAQNQPPPPPPKTSRVDSPAHSTPSRSFDNGPPLPPLPPQSASPAAHRSSRYDSAPPLPPQAQNPPVGIENTGYRNDAQQFSSPQLRMSLSPGVGPGQIPPPQQQLPPPPHPNYQQPPPPLPPQGQWNPQAPQAPQMNQPGPRWEGPGQPPPVQPAPAPPPPDILDEPLTLTISQATVVPPPIPPNPEKDALLLQLAQTLATMRQHSRQQNESSMVGLQAQRQAMLAVMPTLQSEIGQLAQLSNVLTSNSTILHDALHRADGVIEGSRSHPAPEIDELLVAPTVVSNQLYTLVAEERSLGDAIFMLGRAVERGRISPAVFAKMTRSLAREWYLKKALVRKIGLGMGLAPS